MGEKLFIYGTGSLGEKILEYNNRDRLYNIVGFIDDNNAEQSFHGLPILTYDNFKKHYCPTDCKLFVAIGYVKCNSFREIVCLKIIKDGYHLANYISPHSICFGDTIKGLNILVCDNVFIGHGSAIYDGVVLSVGCTLSHENVIDKYSFISSCVVFGGHAKISNNCFIGLHSTIRDSVTIGSYSIVGSGTNVVKSVPEYTVTIGNPGVSTVKDTINVKI